MKSLVFERSVARVAAARVASAFGAGRGAGVGPLRLVDGEPPELPGPDWCRVQPLLAGICGSDLATVDGRSSRYFEPLVSFPFVPGHEVVGVVADEPVATTLRRRPALDAASTGGGGAAGVVETERPVRVVVEPVLGCVARDLWPRCPACEDGRTGNCEHVAFGHLRPGLQTGFCADTGGGWSAAGLVAHRSQLYEVPASMSDEDTVTIEPVACATHAALGAGVAEGDLVAVLGAGTLGLAVTAAVAHLSGSGRLAVPGELVVGARYGHQQHLAAELGASRSLPPEHLARLVRRRSRSLALGGPGGPSGRLTGGADVVFDCVGSAQSLAESLAMVRPRGRIVLVGMPARVSLDLAPLWHREVAMVGAYAYGVERPDPDGPEVRTFDLATEVVVAARTGRLVSALYPLERFEEAIAHAGTAGRRGAVKVAFDLRPPAPEPPTARPQPKGPTP